MTEKIPIIPQRVRRINGSFAFIEHRFLRDGFWSSLDHQELLLYLFLVMVGDRRGISFYCYDRICNLLGVSVDDYILARNTLIKKGKFKLISENWQCTARFLDLTCYAAICCSQLWARKVE